MKNNATSSLLGKYRVDACCLLGALVGLFVTHESFKYCQRHDTPIIASAMPQATQEIEKAQAKLFELYSSGGFEPVFSGEERRAENLVGLKGSFDQINAIRGVVDPLFSVGEKKALPSGEWVYKLNAPEQLAIDKTKRHLWVGDDCNPYYSYGRMNKLLYYMEGATAGLIGGLMLYRWLEKAERAALPSQA